jgi:hypothetical protein
MKSAGLVSSKIVWIALWLIVAAAVLTTMFLGFLLVTIPVCGCAPEPPREEQHQSR